MKIKILCLLLAFLLLFISCNKEESKVVKKEMINEGEEIVYILNTNTKKIHYPYCFSVSSIKDENIDYYYLSDFSYLFSEGYTCCKNCFN